ncbi:response regulator transcription factor [Echinicola soli]|uniref:Response regulator transcription factor n=1 Tax=Echinicola soli TaxID=2591634 RepID=A0A514CN43_9BACT|nr:LytTR family DNA-binding domain-containing protein [Echinicola soli]QDH81124.1 response regulator transcription factor [Echinicola soli]
MIRVMIIDDEQHCRDRILALLKPYGGKVEPLCCGTVAQALKDIDAFRPEMVFLDVQLHDKSGFDVLSATAHCDFALIFTTAFDQYAIQAFKFSAIDYLLKPIDRDGFDRAMEKAFDKVEQAQLTERIDLMLSQLSTPALPKKISIPTRDGFIFLPVADILRCKADVNYTHLYTFEGNKITACKTLKHFDGILQPEGFFRIHSSHLINLCHVKSYIKSGYVTLVDNTRLEVAVRRKEAFLKACNGFLKG